MFISLFYVTSFLPVSYKGWRNVYKSFRIGKRTHAIVRPLQKTDWVEQLRYRITTRI